MSTSQHGLSTQQSSSRAQGAQTLVTAVIDPRVDARATWWKRGEGPWGAGEPTAPPLDPYKYPNYKAKDLEGYLKVIRVSHQQFLRDRESLASSSHRPGEPGLLAQQQPPHQQDSQSAEGAKRKSSTGAGQQPAQGDGLAQALLHVPAHFFNEDFSIEGSGLFQGADTPEELQGRIEELSGYLDVVEVQLMREVQLRSSSIFDAAGEVDALNQMLCGALSRIKTLRQHLNEVDDHTYASACLVGALQQRRNNVSATLDVLQVVEEVASSRVALQLLLDGQDYAGALDLLEVVAHNMEANCGLGLQMFTQTLPQMQETRELLESLLACEFVGLANFSQANAVMESAISQAAQANSIAARQEAGEEEPTARLPEDEGPLMAGGVGSAEAEAAMKEQLHDKLLPIVLALLRVGRLSGAMQQLHDNYAASTKALIREVLERALNPAAGPGGSVSGSLACGGGSVSEGGAGGDFSAVQALQGLSHDGFLQVLSVVHKVVAACLAHLQQLSSIVRDDILHAAKVPAAASNQVARDLKAVQQVVADVAQGRWGKLVSARSHATPRLKLYEFQALAAECTSFAALLEPCSPRAAAAVRLVALAQCRAYVETLHTRSVAQLQHLLEAEQWQATEVPPTFQEIVNRLLERSPNAAANGMSNGGALTNGTAGSVKQQQQQHGDRSGALILHGKRFLLVNTTLMLFKLLDEYLSLADSSPLYCVELGQHVVDLIRLFNNQSCHLVLGAGAVRTAGLRSISAKHLALSCESCYMLAQLVPTLRAVFLAPPPASPAPQQHMSGGTSKPGFAGFEPQRHMLMLEFDRLANDLTVHTREVHSKLVEIMQDRLLLAARQLAAESRTWGVVQQGQPPGAKAFEVSPAVRSLSKQLGTLQSVLVPILQEEEVHYIFGRVASLYCDTLAATLDVLKPPTPEMATMALQQQQQGAHPVPPVQSVDASLWEEYRRLNTLFALQSFRVLPLEPSQSTAYLSRLSTFYVKHYGTLPASHATPAHPQNSATPPTQPPQQPPAAAPQSHPHPHPQSPPPSHPHQPPPPSAAANSGQPTQPSNSTSEAQPAQSATTDANPALASPAAAHAAAAPPTHAAAAAATTTSAAESSLEPAPYSSAAASAAAVAAAQEGLGQADPRAERAAQELKQQQQQQQQQQQAPSSSPPHAPTHQPAPHDHPSSLSGLSPSSSTAEQLGAPRGLSPTSSAGMVGPHGLSPSSSTAEQLGVPHGLTPANSLPHATGTGVSALAPTSSLSSSHSHSAANAAELSMASAGGLGTLPDTGLNVNAPTGAARLGSRGSKGSLSPTSTTISLAGADLVQAGQAGGGLSRTSTSTSSQIHASAAAAAASVGAAAGAPAADGAAAGAPVAVAAGGGVAGSTPAAAADNGCVTSAPADAADAAGVAGSTPAAAADGTAASEPAPAADGATQCAAEFRPLSSGALQGQDSGASAAPSAAPSAGGLRPHKAAEATPPPTTENTAPHTLHGDSSPEAQGSVPGPGHAEAAQAVGVSHAEGPPVSTEDRTGEGKQEKEEEQGGQQQQGGLQHEQPPAAERVGSEEQPHPLL